MTHMGTVGRCCAVLTAVSRALVFAVPPALLCAGFQSACVPRSRDGSHGSCARSIPCAHAGAAPGHPLTLRWLHHHRCCADAVFHRHHWSCWCAGVLASSCVLPRAPVLQIVQAAAHCVGVDANHECCCCSHVIAGCYRGVLEHKAACQPLHFLLAARRPPRVKDGSAAACRLMAVLLYLLLLCTAHAGCQVCLRSCG